MDIDIALYFHYELEIKTYNDSIRNPFTKLGLSIIKKFKSLNNPKLKNNHVTPRTTAN